MLYVVTGGSGSGKSEFAEELAAKCAKRNDCENKIYVATMFPYEDAETRARIKKHGEQRAGKGFTTIEQPVRLEEIAVDSNSVILIECMSNLLANEMFVPEGRLKVNSNATTEQYIINPVLELIEKCLDVIIVTNEVFADGKVYDAVTEEYVRLLGHINSQLAKAAETVVEVVCGIPVVGKGKLPC